MGVENIGAQVIAKRLGVLPVHGDLRMLPRELTGLPQRAVLAAVVVNEDAIAPPERLRERGWTWPTGIAVSFAGIRGVVTLAAVFLLPEATPHREFLQFLAFVVVVATLLEGLALPWIIRRLKLPPPDFAQEASEMQRLLAEAQSAGLEHLESQVTGDEDARVIERLRINALFLSDALENPTSDDQEDAPIEYQRLRRSMIVAERQAVLEARAEGRYQELAVRSVLAFLDAEEAALKSPGPGMKGQGGAPPLAEAARAPGLRRGACPGRCDAAARAGHPQALWRGRAGPGARRSGAIGTVGLAVPAPGLSWPLLAQSRP